MNSQELRRDLGKWGAIAMVVGTVIGSGIFAVPKAMTLQVGSPGMVFVVWVFGGILSLFGALTYAELAAAIPEAGGEYAYLRTAYGPFFGFLYGWTQAWVAKSGSVATLATLFFYYLANFSPGLEGTLWIIPLPIGPGGGPLEIRWGQLCAMAVILILGFVNYFGVRVGGGLQIAVTILKVTLIMGVVVIGMTASVGSVSNYSTSIPAAGGWTGFFAALVAALWAYDGWNNVSMIASEVRNPQRNLPISLIGGVLAVIAIYLLTNMAYFYVLPAADVAASDRVAADMMRKILGSQGAAAVSVVVMISIFAALNGSILSGSRVPYALAKDGLFFRACAYVQPKYRTPSKSILLLSVWSSVLVLTGRYEELYTLVIFPSWILYAMATASVIVLRKTRPDLPRPYKTIGYPVVPVLFVLVAIALILSTLFKSPRESILGLGIIAAGLPFYWRWRRNAAI
jgi:basic amino acid/polyamine antiporter, APA family